MSVMETALALVASNIGGGLLGIPYAFYRLGMPLGLIVCFIVGTLNYFSSMMYLRTKDLTPRRLESVYEISYLLFGRAAIFVVCSVMFLNCYGAIILYYLIIGDTYGTLSTQLLFDAGADNVA